MPESKQSDRQLPAEIRRPEVPATVLPRIAHDRAIYALGYF